MSRTFKDKLTSNDFLITAEVSPPKGTDLAEMLSDAELTRGWVDALNVTDNQKAIMRMSPLAVSKALLDSGHEVIMQLTCRDRNRLALQSDLLGAYSMGIRNICIMTGDHTTKGDHPKARPVYDLDSVQLLNIIRKMQEGLDLAGNVIDNPPQFVVGAVTNTDPSKKAQMMKLRKKVKTGIDFMQTQAVYDISMFEDFMESIGDIEVPIIAGVIPLRSANMARFMNGNIPGISVPDEIIERMDSAERPMEEGVAICAEAIKELQKLCRGIHLMPIGKHNNTPTILELADIRKK
ncbi:5,10-methylenetetrahydrofolate reductase [Methanolobus vulcani]|jgi:5,10-methylenetetrahydrofolate reductase|uniref:5,10-methylenetetrahydrofolate reductase n=1 Tax=Methanolobus vulcani TaxID=38026 RepID=A0A7Z7FFJ9_9EURY|nr:methylenetetrahydrofolate reductase [Methanolobus vulcani]SDG32117.1 5,10-methylenetetrahydrofolate reductase [Methanolobus vulcani]